METKTNKVLLITELVFVICCLIYVVKLVSETRDLYLECREKSTIQEVGYYRCAGTKKNPKYCSIPIEENNAGNRN